MLMVVVKPRASEWEALAGGVLRWRAVGVGSLLLFPNAYWVIYMEKVRPGPYPTIISLFLNCVVWLAVLVGVNKILARWRPQAAFTPAELLLIYILSRARLAPYFWATLWAGVLGSVASFWGYLHQAYALGAAAEFHHGRVFGQEAFNRLHSWLTTGSPPNTYAQMMTGVGFLTALGLRALRSAIPGFPFHPIGYAISGSWSMHLVWLPLLLAWCLKWLIVRYGGLPVYRRWLPFFLGLIVGEAIVRVGWVLIGWGFNIPTYAFWGE